MGDQQRWFKLWTSALSDPDLCALPPNLRWAWAALGAYTKTHGTRGVLVTRLDNPALAAAIGVTPEAVFGVLNVLPNITVEECKNGNGKCNVTWANWQKYQVDSSTSRTAEWRRAKRRGEERRREESITPAIAGVGGAAKETAPPPTHWVPPAWFGDLLTTSRNFAVLTNGKHSAFWTAMAKAYDPYEWLAWDDEIRKADAWIEANPQRRPRDVRRFLRNWFERAVERRRKEIPSATPTR